tara:strand:- start:2303 stop:3082 length:780 start_codon:yes stop_codon:yes gene_type:complete
MGIPMYGQNKDGNALEKLADGNEQVYRFATPPIVSDYEHTAAQLVDGTAGDQTIHSYADGLQLTFFPIVGQAIDKPAAATTGMDYAYDQTADDGWQWVMSDSVCKGREGVDRFTVGLQAFEAELEFKLADVSGTDDCAFGFAKVDVHRAAIDDCDELACLNVISGDIKIETVLNNGTTTTTDTTDNWADAEVHSLKVKVAKSGAVTYEIDGNAPTTTASFTFDAGEVVTPMMYLLQASDLCENVILQKLTVKSDKGSLE